MQTISIACIRKKLDDYSHCLIICGVNGLKWNWKAEIEKHSNETAYILGTRYDRKGNVKIGTVKDRLDDLKALGVDLDHEINNHYFLITNIETLRNDDIIEELRDLCDKDYINMLALDEGHKCFDYNTSIQTDLGELKIGDIVENKINCNILSFNHTTNKFEYSPIKNHFKNAVQENLIELEILDENNKTHKIKCTKNHKIYTKNRGYVEADLLTSDDIIILHT